MLTDKPDLNTVIKVLECCYGSNVKVTCNECPYYKIHDCHKRCAQEATEFLKMYSQNTTDINKSEVYV